MNSISTSRADSEWLELVNRGIFEAGFSPSVVAHRWPAMREALHGFDPVQVAAMDESDVERLGSDPRLIRNHRKIRAAIRNARVLCQIAVVHGSWEAWISQWQDRPYAERAETLMAALDGVGPFAAYEILRHAGLAALEDRPEPVC